MTVVPFLDLTDAIILLERRVSSSWLEDIVYRGRNNKMFPGEELILFKTKKKPTVYICRGLTHQDYLNWINAPSKGKYFRVIQKEYDNTWFEYHGDEKNHTFWIVKFDKITEPSRNKTFAKVHNYVDKLSQDQRDKSKVVTKKSIKKKRAYDREYMRTYRARKKAQKIVDDNFTVNRDRNGKIDVKK